MKKIIIVPNATKDSGLRVTANAVKKLLDMGMSPYIDKMYNTYGLESVNYYDVVPDDASLILVIGGDGSIIDASRIAVEYDIPMLGINLGKVGYLSEVDPENLSVLEKLLNNEYKIEGRMLLSGEKIALDNSESVSERLAMNDIVITKQAGFGISEILIENGRGDSLKYRADGVIFATPVGSTAYSLSAGGPVISHNLSAITVTPVSAHSLFNRSIVYDQDEILTAKNVSESELSIHIDGRHFESLKPGEICRIRCSKKQLKMISFEEKNMFTALFKKIKVIDDKV